MGHNAADSAGEMVDVEGGSTPSDIAAPRMMLFDGTVSQRGYRINKFAKSLTTESGRAAFAADPRGAMQSFGLDVRQMDLIAARDWQALLQEGASVYLLAKLAIAQGESLMDIGAQMRGQTTSEFLQSLEAQRQQGRV